MLRVLFLFFERCVAAAEFGVTAAGDDEFRAAIGADVSFAGLCCCHGVCCLSGCLCAGFRVATFRGLAAFWGTVQRLEEAVDVGDLIVGDAVFREGGHDAARVAVLRDDVV